MKMNPRKFSEKELVKVNVIARAAAKLFEKNGYLETSLKDISAAAKLSKGGIYHYFANKHELLYFILDSYMELLFGGLEEELKEIPDPSSKIQLIMYRHLKHYNKHVPEAKALLNHVHNLPAPYFKTIAEKQKKYARILTQVLLDFFNGGMDVNKAKAISYTMFGMCNSIMYWYDPKGPVTLDELSRISYDLFMTGINDYKNQIKNVGRTDRMLCSHSAT